MSQLLNDPTPQPASNRSGVIVGALSLLVLLGYAYALVAYASGN